MATTIELIERGTNADFILEKIDLAEDAPPFPLNLAPNVIGQLNEIGYEVFNVAGEGTAIQPIFPRPEPGKLPQGSKPEILIGNSRELPGVAYEGLHIPLSPNVVARVTDIRPS